MIFNEFNSQPETPTIAIARRAEVISELINNGSIELCDSGYAIPRLPEILPYQKSIFVPATRKRPLPALIDTLKKLNEAGFNPVPHIAARRIDSQSELEMFLKSAVGACGVRRVLLVGGDVARPTGPYGSARSLLQTGLLQNAGVREVAFAGYPDVHPHIARDDLESELQAKLDVAQNDGIGASIVTQFSFVPQRIIDYCLRLTKLAPRASVYVGIPGPCDPLKLLKYARICGVSASAKMLGDMGFKAVKLAIHSESSEQLQLVARGVAAHKLDNVVGVHVFSFGNIYESAKWLTAQTAGE